MNQNWMYIIVFRSNMNVSAERVNNDCYFPIDFWNILYQRRWERRTIHEFSENKRTHTSTEMWGCAWQWAPQRERERKGAPFWHLSVGLRERHAESAEYASGFCFVGEESQPHCTTYVPCFGEDMRIHSGLHMISVIWNVIHNVLVCSVVDRKKT